MVVSRDPPNTSIALCKTSGQFLGRLSLLAWRAKVTFTGAVISNEMTAGLGLRCMGANAKSHTCGRKAKNQCKRGSHSRVKSKFVSIEIFSETL